MKRFLSILLAVLMLAVMLPVTAMAEDGDGSRDKPYTREQFEKMTRQQYIEAQNTNNGTIYVTVGNYDYSATKHGTLGNGVRDDTPGQTPDHSKINAYGENGYRDAGNDGANGKKIVFVGGTITSGAKGYTDIDDIGTSLLLAVPAYTHVTFQGTTFNGVFSFNYQLYTSPWSQLGCVDFENCTFNGIIVGAMATQSLVFNNCTFNNYTNDVSPNNSNPTWIRPAYGNWTKDDNEGQGNDFRSLTTIKFTNNKVTSTRPVKFEYISQWDIRSTVTAIGNSFDISAQDGDTKTKNVGLYLGAHTSKNAFDLTVDNNTKSDNTAALYAFPESHSELPAGSTIKNSDDTSVYLTDVVKWKTSEKLTLNSEGQVTEEPITPPEEPTTPGTIIIYPPTDDTPKTDDQKNPTTGANDFVGIAAAAAVMALLGSAVILRKK